MQKHFYATVILIFFIASSAQALSCLRHQTICNHHAFCLKYDVTHTACYRCTKTSEVRFGSSKKEGLMRMTCTLKTASDLENIGYHCAQISDEQPCLKTTEKLVCNQQCI